jgi:type VI secretion system secreted protein VgrG
MSSRTSPIQAELAQLPQAEGLSSVALDLLFEDDEQSFGVIEAHGRFALSEAFELSATIRTASAHQPHNFVGRPVRLLLREGVETTALQVMCRAAELFEPAAANLGDGLAGFRYHLTLVPRSDWLRLRSDHRLFRDCTAMAAAAELVRRFGAKIGRLKQLGAEALPMHEVRAQYAETDWDCLTRLLAADGVSFWYDFAEATSLVLASDTRRAFRERQLPFTEEEGRLVAGEPAVWGLRASGQLRAGNFTVRDDWMLRPDFDAVEGAQTASSQELELYRFAYGAGADNQTLKRQAELSLVQHTAESSLYHLVASVFVAPGTRLTVLGAAQLLEELLVVSTSSQWRISDEAVQRHELVCVPAARPWLPARQEKPRISGLHKGTVIGEGEIDLDEYGRVLCEFEWDRGRLSTRRIEVSQAWAGPGYGLFTAPRVGEQVLISYLDGDPDEPVVVGRIHNAKNKPPLNLPEDSAKSVWRSKSTPDSDGYNQILFDDRAGNERFSIHAQLDFDSTIERDASGLVGRDLTFQVARHADMKVTGFTNVNCGLPTTWQGSDLIVKATGALTLVSETRNDMVQGKYWLNAGTLEVETIGAESHVNGAEFSVKAKAITLEAGGSSISILPGSITLNSGGSTLVLEKGKITLKADLIELNP